MNKTDNRKCTGLGDTCTITKCVCLDNQIQERKDILLRATFDILKKCEEGAHVKDVMGVTAVWDGAECDGSCLMQEIKDLLDIEE